MSIVKEEVVNYINQIQPQIKGKLGELQRESLEQGVPIIPLETARFLSTLLSIKCPKNVLEVGCAVGFSASLMCQYLAQDGHITTIDRYEVMIKAAKETFAKLGLTDKITLIEGDACEELKTLEGEFDLIFLDAAKGQYINILPECLRLLKVGGLMIADDVLQDGRIAQPREEIPKRQRTIHDRMGEFLQTVSNMEGFESTIIPIGDGILLAHKIR